MRSVQRAYDHRLAESTFFTLLTISMLTSDCSRRSRKARAPTSRPAIRFTTLRYLPKIFQLPAGSSDDEEGGHLGLQQYCRGSMLCPCMALRQSLPLFPGNRHPYKVNVCLRFRYSWPTSRPNLADNPKHSHRMTSSPHVLTMCR